MKDIVEGNWKIIKGKVKQQWGKFTDDEITQMKGSKDELSGQLQKKYGYKKEEAEEKIDDFLKRNDIKKE